MSEKIDVLDKGYVRLVDHMGSDLSVVRSARVSYDADWRAGTDKGSDTRLIKYLYRNHHTSPFEAVTFQFEVKAPIFIMRQWHRHRTWSYNELSARYSELPDEFYLPDPDHIGVQSKHNKQMRELNMSVSDDTASAAIYLIDDTSSRAFEAYQTMLNMGVPRELARSVLPVGTYTRMFAAVNLHNLFQFLRLRLHDHAQYEIRVYAEALLELIRPIVPISVEAFEESML